jgi:hypothetical protein
MDETLNEIQSKPVPVIDSYCERIRTTILLGRWIKILHRNRFMQQPCLLVKEDRVVDIGGGDYFNSPRPYASFRLSFE